MGQRDTIQINAWHVGIGDNMNEEWFKILKQINTDGITFMNQDVLNAYNKIKVKIPQITSLLSGKNVNFYELEEAIDLIRRKQRQGQQQQQPVQQQQRRVSRSRPSNDFEDIASRPRVL